MTDPHPAHFQLHQITPDTTHIEVFLEHASTVKNELILYILTTFHAPFVILRGVIGILVKFSL